MASPIRSQSSVTSFAQPAFIPRQGVPPGVGNAPTTITPPPQEKGYVAWAITSIFNLFAQFFGSIYNFFCSCFRSTPPATPAAAPHLPETSTQLEDLSPEPENLIPEDSEGLDLYLLELFGRLSEAQQKHIYTSIGKQKAAFWSVRSYETIGENWVMREPKLLLPYLRTTV